MADQPKAHRPTENASNTHQAIKFLTVAALGLTLMVFSGLTLTATIICLVVATPPLVLFSPVLVPAAIVTFLVASGLAFSGGLGVAALSVLSWIYGYVTGKHPPGSEQLDRAREALASKARDVKQKAREYDYQVQNMAQEVTQGQS